MINDSGSSNGFIGRRAIRSSSLNCFDSVLEHVQAPDSLQKLGFKEKILLGPDDQPKGGTKNSIGIATSSSIFTIFCVN